MIESIKRYCDVDLGAQPYQDGSALAEAFYRALVAQGKDYAEQRHLLIRAVDHVNELDFGNACLDRVARIDDFRQRRAAVVDHEVAKRNSGVPKNKDWATGEAYATLRFAPAREVCDELCDAVEDMVALMVKENYLEAAADLPRDLRQGLGYYRPGEDPLRRRRTARWLKGQNVLHCWIAAMLGGRDPLIRVAPGAPGCWVTAASLFIDRQGKAFTYSRLEHGTLKNQTLKNWLHTTIPQVPNSTVLI
ncbi:MAG: hypothetical protein IJ634_06020 [Bacteroidales bacterium]|nr:hypothetical protein [Bacteroidales bacterium]